jgi:DNA adenine methylase
MGYLGAKSASGAYQAVIAAMAPHETYIETHLGSGFILGTKPQAAVSHGIDLDPAAPGLARDYGQAVTLHNLDCVPFLLGFDFAAAGRVFVYADPPYVGSTRTSSKRYRHDYTDDDHKRLLTVLKSLPCAVMISGYPSKLYDDLLTGWRTYEFQVMTRGGVRTEKLWMNYDPDAAFWASYAGRDKTERQNIKRKAASWADMYAKLAPGERLAIMAALLEVHATEQASTAGARTYLRRQRPKQAPTPAPAEAGADTCAAGNLAGQARTPARSAKPELTQARKPTLEANPERKTDA